MLKHKSIRVIGENWEENWKVWQSCWINVTGFIKYYNRGPETERSEQRSNEATSGSVRINALSLSIGGV